MLISSSRLVAGRAAASSSPASFERGGRRGGIFGEELLLVLEQPDETLLRLLLELSMTGKAYGDIHSFLSAPEGGGSGDALNCARLGSVFA